MCVRRRSEAWHFRRGSDLAGARGIPSAGGSLASFYFSPGLALLSRDLRGRDPLAGGLVRRPRGRTAISCRSRFGMGFRFFFFFLGMGSTLLELLYT
jgi:hypothetical protein